VVAARPDPSLVMYKRGMQPRPLRLLMAIRNEVQRVASHFHMCKTNGWDDGPFSEEVEREMELIGRCNAAPYATQLERFLGCYIDEKAMCDFGAALMEDQPERFRPKPSNRFPGCRHLLQFSMYGLGLQSWLLTAGVAASNVGIVQMEAFSEHHVTVANNIQAFLGISSVDDVPKGKTYRSRRHDATDLPVFQQLDDFFQPHRAYLLQLLGSRVGGQVNLLGVRAQDFPGLVAVRHPHVKLAVVDDQGLLTRMPV